MRPSSKITLNNGGDGLELKNPEEKIIDSISFGKASLNQSYNRTESDWAWSTTLTPEKANVITNKPAPQPKKTNATENKSQESTESARLPDGQESQEVKLVEELKGSSKVSVFFVGFLVALCSAIAFLIIKNNLKNFWH
jgi:hypothetical protein